MPTRGEGRLAERTALITGAGSGIGRETALLFAGEGANVVVADRDGEGARITVEAIADAGGRAHAVTVDGHAKLGEALGEFSLRASGVEAGALAVDEGSAAGAVVGQRVQYARHVKRPAEKRAAGRHL